MALSRKQLRLVFAKLREKGLLKYLKKSPQSLRRTLAEKKYYPQLHFTGKQLDTIFSKSLAERYIAGLPQHHRKLARVQDIRLWDRKTIGDEDMGAVGRYDAQNRIIHVVRNPRFHSETGAYAGYLPMEKEFPGFKLPSKISEAGWRARLVRSGKLGAARVFYHEYAHSMWPRIPQEIRAFFRTKSRELGVAVRNPDYDEGFADFYSWYASTKASRIHLKRTYPDVYEQMKRFFEEG